METDAPSTADPSRARSSARACRGRRSVPASPGRWGLAALALAVAAAAALAPADAAAQQEGARGVQLEAAGAWNSLVGGSYPFDETGVGATAGVRYRWPGGFSLGVTGLRISAADASRPAGDPRRDLRRWAALADLRYQLAGLAPVRPYVGVRAGWTRLEDASTGTAGNGTAYAMTAGTEIWASDRFAFRLAASAGGHSVSGLFGEGENTTGVSWTAEAGVSVLLGGTVRDGDGDGVVDDVDDCPATAPGVPVGPDGCPEDGDGDGIADHRDACPDSPPAAEVDERGCPLDADGDGVFDGTDECPGTPAGAPVDESGCAADADGDGVPDDRDECPETPEGAGVDENGCPADADGDGVLDASDECPGTRYLEEVDGRGCSRVQQRLAETGRFTLPGLPLELEEVRLRGPSRAILAEVARELAERPDAVLEIRVLTRREGQPAYNRSLSQTLAEALKAQLLQIEPGIAPARVRAAGYGEASPPGDVAEDRPRVDFVFVGGGG